MIVTVTLNPAVDKNLKTSRVIMGSVNRMEEATNVAGGKGINVAKVLKQYDYDVKAIGFLGGYQGAFIEDTLNEMGINNSFTKVSGETRTSTNVISEDGYVTEFLEPGPQITEAELDAFISSFKKEIENAQIVVISGSIPMGVPSAIYATLTQIANEMKVKVLLDSSGESLKKGMYEHPFMIKPNLKELESIMGRRINGMHEINEAARSIVELGVQNVCVSMGNKGILYAYKKSDTIESIYVPAPKVKVINTVGSGDSAVAAFAMGIMEELDEAAILKKCVAISAANTCSMENGIIPKDVADELEEKLSLSSIDY